jgi:hypothetical protein
VELVCAVSFAVNVTATSLKIILEHEMSSVCSSGTMLGDNVNVPAIVLRSLLSNHA